MVFIYCMNMVEILVKLGSLLGQEALCVSQANGCGQGLLIDFCLFHGRYITPKMGNKKHFSWTTGGRGADIAPVTNYTFIIP